MTLNSTEECLDFLKEAKDVLENMQVLKAQESQLEEKEKQLERTYAAEKKRTHDQIQQTIRSRRDEIHANYDKELAKAQEQLKKIRSKREKAKNQGIKERITDETEGYYSNIQSHMTQLRNVVKQHHMPFYCKSPIYYSLYFPRHLKEFLTLLMFVLIFFVAIPCGGYLCIPNRRPLYLALIYVLDLLLFGSIYVIIGNRNRDRYPEALKMCRELLDQAVECRKLIRRKAKSIRRDRDEERYGLGQFDDEISRLQHELDEVTAKKKEALDTYEKVTRNIISDEIEANNRPHLEQLKQEYDQSELSLKAVRQELKTRNLSFSDQYGTYLGKEFMDPGKVAKLCLIVQEGQAANVSEAIERYHEKEKQDI